MITPASPRQRPGPDVWICRANWDMLRNDPDLGCGAPNRDIAGVRAKATARAPVSASRSHI
jgi:hypothetical protein